MTKTKTVFSLAQLKREFPKDREEIKTYLFLGIINPTTNEYPDAVRAYFY
jgi:hypothetical protein